MSEFRKNFNTQITIVFLLGLVAHIPIFAFQAWHFGTNWIVALGLSSVVLVGTAVSYWKSKTSNLTLYTLSVAYEISRLK